MNTKSALSVLCLCLMTGGANAAIIVDPTSSYYQFAYVVGNNVSDSHELIFPVVTSYGDTLYASATDSFTLADGSTYSTTGSASSTLAMNADIYGDNTGGAFSASSSYSVSSQGWLTAAAYQRATFAFSLTSAYAYTLDMTAVAGTWADFSFANSFAAEDNILVTSSNGAINIHQSGILLAGSNGHIIASTSGWAQNGNYGSGGFGVAYANPGFQYTLTLTPVPVPEPEAWGLMLSGLGLVGWAARRRQQTAV